MCCAKFFAAASARTLLGQEKPFMHEMVYAVRDEMQDAYPELSESADRVAKVVEAEERQFARVLRAMASPTVRPPSNSDARAIAA